MTKLNKWILVLLCASKLAFAEPVSVDFKAATVVDVVQTLVKEVLRRDFVIAPDVLQSDRRITVNVRQVEPDNLLPLLEGILRTVRVQIVDKGGVLYVENLTQMDTTPQPAPAAIVEPGKAGEGGEAKPLPADNRQQEFDPQAEIEVYWPQHRGVDMLTQAVKLAGAKLIENNEKAGAVVFAGRPEVNQRALQLLEKFDRPTAAVNVKAVVVEYTESNEKSNAFEALASLFDSHLGISISSGTRTGNGITINTTSLKAILTAMEGDSRFKYVAEPSLKVLDGEKGKITVGQEVPTRGQVTMDANGNSLQSIVYKTAGVMLELAPKIYRDTIVLTVNQQISTFTTTTTSGIDSPTVMKRDLSTTLDAKSGDVIVMAGMDETRESSNRSGFSFLPKAMQGSGSNNSRSQILLLLEVNRADGLQKANYAPVEDKSRPYVDS